MKRRTGKYLTYLATGTIVTLVFGGIALSFRGCEGDPNKARELVESQGYTQVEVDGTDRWSCGRDDQQSNAFTAVAPNGKRVQGVVCCGYNGCGKGCTVRWR